MNDTPSALKVYDYKIRQCINNIKNNMMNNFYLKNKEKSNAFHAAFKRALLLMVLVAAAFLPEETKAAVAGSEVSNDVVTYDLKLGDVVVTSENCNDLQFGQSSGTANYDAGTKTLTLDGIGTSNHTIYSKIDGLTIKIKGAVIFSSSKTINSLDLEANTVIDGSEDNYFAFQSLRIGERSEVVFRNFNDFTASSIRGVSGEAGEKLVFENCKVAVEGSISQIASMTFVKCALHGDVAFDEAKHAVANYNGDVAEFFIIEKCDVYDLWICGVQVTSLNSNDLSVLPGVKQGSIYYSELGNVLEVLDCRIESPEGIPAIRSNMENLCVRASYSNNDIIAKGAPALKFEKGGGVVNAQGNSSLLLSTSDDQPAILATDSLVFDNANVIASGKYGVSGSGNGVFVKIDGGTLKLYGKESATCNLSGCTQSNIMVKAPEGAEYDSGLRGFAVGGKLVSDTLYMDLERYGVYIGNYRVDETNYKDLSVLPVVDGKADFDPATGTLTLDNAQVNSFIEIYTENPNVVVKGKCVIDVQEIMGMDYGILFNNINKANIRGVDGAELKITFLGGEYSEGMSCGIAVIGKDSDANLTIANCDMDIKCSYPIVSLEGITSKLCIKNSNVMLNTQNYPIMAFQSLELSGCKVTSPENLTYVESQGFCIEGEETEYRGSVIIERDNAVGIGSIKTEIPAARQGVYTIDGVKLDTSEENLPAGLYIINGKKVLKK